MPLKEPSEILARWIERRRSARNAGLRKAWDGIQSRGDWEAFRDARIAVLLDSLGDFPAPPEEVAVHVARVIEGPGYAIKNLLFESRPGLWVTANLYVPDPPRDAMPGILICHSHHRPKPQRELQDTGMNFARLGCMVLVMDQLGHGERRQHPFASGADFPREFRVSRQDYYFRYDSGIQLHLLGDSLIGWMAWDLSRGVDLLLSRDGIDPERILLFGAVAGGGDPAAVAAALDSRITCAVPFNFGGPQRGDDLPDDARETFNYIGGGSWESTRNLRLSGRDGFTPGVILAAIAPRYQVYAHEFAWDGENDPEWHFLKRIYDYYDAGERLDSVHGFGHVTLRPPKASHCTEIGAVHRKPLYPILSRWFGIPVPDEEYRGWLEERELDCLTPAARRKLQPRTLCDLAGELARERMAAARKRRAPLSAEARRRQLREEWSALLGDVASKQPRIVEGSRETATYGDARLETFTLLVEPGVYVPVRLLLPLGGEQESMPLVVAVAQAGGARLLEARAEAFARLLERGVAVCLPDLRGTGATRPGDDRGRQTRASGLSSSELMLGGTFVGARLADLRTVLAYLRADERLDVERIALWGDSLAEATPRDVNVEVPRGIERPGVSEPLGGLVVMLAALYDDSIHAVHVHGGLSGFASLLESPFTYLPHDVVVPGALTTGDLADVAAAIAPRPLRLQGLVDGRNLRIGAEAARRIYEPAAAAYREQEAGDQLVIADDEQDFEAATAWLAQQIAGE